MKKRILIVAAVLALAGPAALATETSYTFLQGSWASVDIDQGDSGTGPALDASYGVTQMVHVLGSYEDVGFDTADMTTWQVGAGLHHTMMKSFDLFGEASYVDMEVEVPTVGSASEDGFAIAGGLRKPLGESWEVNGAVEQIDVGPQDDTLIGVNALYTMKERYALTAGYKMGDADTVHVGFRWSFGRR